MTHLHDKDLAALLQQAKDAAQNAYAPYSNYRVGSAVLTDKGVFTGCNIENASSPLGVCAEKAALANARIHGARRITALAVWCLDARASDLEVNPETMPCGSCRQWLAELAPDAVVVTNGSQRVFTVPELLPHAFSLPGEKK